MAPLICTFGDLMLDVVVIPRAPLARDSDTPAHIRLSAGGQAANVAAWATSLGGRSRLICSRGDDIVSGMAAGELRTHGVEVCGPILPGRGGVVVSTREGDGGRTMASDPGAAAGLTASAVDPEWIRDADVLHVSGYCLLREGMAVAAVEAARHAHRVTLDLASANDIALCGLSVFSERVWALGPSLIFANEEEKSVVGALPPVEWVLKRGAGGAEFPEGAFPSEFAGEPIDTTGAGDALAAGYLVGGPELAMSAAARCIAAVGAMPPEL